MTIPPPVVRFYQDIWNAGDASALDVLTENFSFRGSLGDELVGREAFWGYVTRMRTALADYRCEIIECVAVDNAAFARMRFAGRHVGPFLGFAPTQRLVEWSGAALFHINRDEIQDIWVLGDVEGLRKILEENAKG